MEKIRYKDLSFNLKCCALGGLINGLIIFFFAALITPNKNNKPFIKEKICFKNLSLPLKICAIGGVFNFCLFILGMIVSV